MPPGVQQALEALQMQVAEAKRDASKANRRADVMEAE